MRIGVLIIFLFIGIFSQKATAQFNNNGCVDSLLIRYGFYCAYDYEPVCGCNVKTYRNQCFAQNDGILNYMDGPCEGIGMDILANPVVSTVNIDIRLKFEDTVDLWIYDHRGTLYFFENYPYGKWLDLYLDVSSYPLGVYLVIAQSGNGEYVFKKMVKTSS